MNKKKSLAFKLATFLLSFATIVPTIGGCGFGILGEPELPIKIQKKKIKDLSES